MKKILVEIVGIIVALVLIVQTMPVLALTEQEELEREKDKINDQLEDAIKKQEEIEKQKSSTMKSVEDLIAKISNAESEVDVLESKVSNLQAEIKLKEKDIQQKQKEYTKQEQLLDARLIAMYENGETSYLDVLLTASSMTDFLAKYYAASELVEYDKELIRTTKEQKEKIEKEKEELESNKKELDTALAQAEQKSTELKGLKKQKQNQVNKLTEEEKELQKEIEDLEAANKKIAKEIEEARIRYQQQLEELKNQQGGNTAAGSGYFMRPVATGPITATAYYSSGKFHGAVDYGVPVGTPIKAAADGVVMTTANLSNSYGTYIVIEHANGLQTYYAHGTRGSIVVKPGQIVKKGEKIMLSGILETHQDHIYILK